MFVDQVTMDAIFSGSEGPIMGARYVSGKVPIDFNTIR
jgi:hypothetical protein